MNLQNAKIYNDGSHFIAIPQGAYPSGKGCKRRVAKPMQQLTLTNESPPETPKERFEKAYKESQSLPKRERKAHIKESLAEDFPNKDELNAFVAKHYPEALCYLAHSKDNKKDYISFTFYRTSAVYHTFWLVPLFGCNLFCS